MLYVNKLFFLPTDIEECLQALDNCDRATSKCINTPGSYNCSCYDQYYVWNGSICFGKMNYIISYVQCCSAAMILFTKFIDLRILVAKPFKRRRSLQKAYFFLPPPTEVPASKMQVIPRNGFHSSTFV